MGLKVITPASAVITTADLKDHLRVDVADEDALIDAYLLAAMSLAQHYSGRAIGEQTLELALDEFPDGAVKLECPPVTSIVSVSYLDATGTTQTMNSSNYTLDDYGDQAHWLLAAADTDWPSTYEAANAVKVRYVAGSQTLEHAVRQALLLTVGDFFENRTSAQELSPAAKALLNTRRVWSL